MQFLLLPECQIKIKIRKRGKGVLLQKLGNGFLDFTTFTSSRRLNVTPRAIPETALTTQRPNLYNWPLPWSAINYPKMENLDINDRMTSKATIPIHSGSFVLRDISTCWGIWEDVHDRIILSSERHSIYGYLWKSVQCTYQILPSPIRCQRILWNKEASLQPRNEKPQEKKVFGSIGY